MFQVRDSFVYAHSKLQSLERADIIEKLEKAMTMLQ